MTILVIYTHVVKSTRSQKESKKKRLILEQLHSVLMNMKRLASISLVIVCLCSRLQIIESEIKFYIESAHDFDNDCKIQCSPNDHTFEDIYNYTETYRDMILEKYGDTELVRKAISKIEMEDSYEKFLLNEYFTKTWNSTTCKNCQNVTDQNNKTLDRAYYTMDKDCNPTCKKDLHYYHRKQHPGKCVKCDVNKCKQGEYLTGDTCENCKACVQPIDQNWEFTTRGLILDDNSSCEGKCIDGYFEDVEFDINTEETKRVCLQHQEVECNSGEYEVRGTSLTDAYCERCGECEGMNQTQSCSGYQNAVCELCEPLELESGARYVFNNCTKECLYGYVMNKTSGTCEYCMSENGGPYQCAPGQTFRPNRQYCQDCEECVVTKPDNSDFVQNCNWKCVDGYTLQNNTCESLDNLFQQHQTIQSSVLCGDYQQLDCDTQRRICKCIHCSSVTSIVHPDSNHENSRWRWMPTRSKCTWECMPDYYIVRLSPSTVDCLPWEYFQKQAELQAIEVTNFDEIPIEREERKEKIPLMEMMLFSFVTVFTMIFLICTQR